MDNDNSQVKPILPNMPQVEAANTLQQIIAVIFASKV